MKNILLIEPNYKNKYPPLGLMKISYFHKNILGHNVRFTKGVLPNVLANTKWDHVYVTSLFTFEWAQTIKAIEYAKTLVDNINQITVGGIAATLLPDQIYQETGIHPVCGLLNEPGKLDLPGDECIDQMTPDYSILDDIDYTYAYHNAYFLSATKGCGMRCGFCAVQTLEPTYVSYLDIKGKITEIDRNFGPKRDLLLMDNNVLRSSRFNEIIDDVIAAGFGKGATYINPKTGKQVRRYVDFNQGLDANFLTEAKAQRLGEIALKPARIAFDHIEDREMYERAFRLCAKYGITELSNYVLYNSEDFGGKGTQYRADTPEDLYDRMRFTLDLKEEINKYMPSAKKIAAFSFPMRYIPLSAHERGYVGSNWNPKYLRAVQCMLIPTQGKGVGSRSFFEADFGKNSAEFVRNLCMPDKLIAARGEFSVGGRGHIGETPEETMARKDKWDSNQRKIKEWNRLYNLLGEEKESFQQVIRDNEFLPEKCIGIVSDLQKKLYLHYLSGMRLMSLLGIVSLHSPTYQMLHSYLTNEFMDMYKDLLSIVVTADKQQSFVFKNFISFFGTKGLSDILRSLNKCDYNADKLLAKWDKISTQIGIYDVDFELIRIYCRYIELNILTKHDHLKAKKAILGMDMPTLAIILYESLEKFRDAIQEIAKNEMGEDLLKKAMEVILSNIQIKLISFLGGHANE